MNVYINNSLKLKPAPKPGTLCLSSLHSYTKLGSFTVEFLQLCCKWHVQGLCLIKLYTAVYKCCNHGSKTSWRSVLHNFGFRFNMQFITLMFRFGVKHHTFFFPNTFYFCSEFLFGDCSINNIVRCIKIKSFLNLFSFGHQ